MSPEQIRNLSEPVDLAARDHADYHWPRGDAQNHGDVKWNFSYTDFKDGAEWQRNHPSPCTTDTDRLVEALEDLLMITEIAHGILPMEQEIIDKAKAALTEHKNKKV